MYFLMINYFCAHPQVSRYRHYGVYLTGERDQEGQEQADILSDPICVLDRKTFQQFLEQNSIPPSILDRETIPAIFRDIFYSKIYGERYCPNSSGMEQKILGTVNLFVSFYREK